VEHPQWGVAEHPSGRFPTALLPVPTPAWGHGASGVARLWASIQGSTHGCSWHLSMPEMRVDARVWWDKGTLTAWPRCSRGHPPPKQGPWGEVGTLGGTEEGTRGGCPQCQAVPTPTAAAYHPQSLPGCPLCHHWPLQHDPLTSCSPSSVVPSGVSAITINPHWDVPRVTAGPRSMTPSPRSPLLCSPSSVVPSGVPPSLPGP